MAACGGKGDKKAVGIDPAYFDTTVAPSADFYQYATGGWQVANPLKPEYARFGSFDVLSENNERRIRDLFTELQGSAPAAGTVGQKIADLYRLGLDSVRLNDEKLEPVKADLAAIEAAEGRTALSQLLGAMHRTMGNPLFGAGVESDMMDSNTNMLYIAQDGLGMGNRDYYLEEASEPVRAAYREYIARLFTMVGRADEAAAAVEAVMDIETRIATASLSSVELRDPYKSYNKISIETLRKDYPAFDWDAYFAEVKLPAVAELSLSHPKAIKVAMDIFSGDRAKLNYYLAFNVLDSAAGFLDDEMRTATFDFYGRAMQGKQEDRPRWKRALAVPNGTLGEAVGEMYVAKYFPASSKEKMLKLVGDLQAALAVHIEGLEWMSAETKAKALEKLSTFTVKIGYPDKWKDYSSLAIDPALTYWDNIKRARAWHSDDNMTRAGHPVDKAEWHMPPQMVNAYYNPTTNEICFPAAILQPPFFDPAADDAVNYGAIGVVIGHEMTHGFDDQGRQFDKTGNLADWWTAADADAFKVRAEGLAAQFDAIEVLPGLNANGHLTLGENIADQGGLRVAYTAMKMAQNGVEPAPIDGFTAEQRFYLAYATLWAQNIRDEEIRRLTTIDPHSLGKLRVNATLRNIDTFHTAFGITEGPMFTTPEERVVIW